MAKSKTNFLSAGIAWLRERVLGNPSSEGEAFDLDPYRGVVFFLWALAVVGTAFAFAAGKTWGLRSLLDMAATLWLAMGMLAGVAIAQRDRAVGRPASLPKKKQPKAPPTPSPQAEVPGPPLPEDSRSLLEILLGTSLLGAFFALRLAYLDSPGFEPLPPKAWFWGFVGTLGALGAGFSFTVARYFRDVDPARLPEAGALCRGARVLAWLFLLAAASLISLGTGLESVARGLRFLVLIVDGGFCWQLFRAKPFPDRVAFPLELSLLSALGDRLNFVGSALDFSERRLGIDLRSSWALEFVRSKAEPVILGLVFLGWLSTSLSVIGTQEQGLVERLGVPVPGEPLSPGLHLHWPWPVDEVFRTPSLRVQDLEVGHEGEEGGGPENVLWAIEHAPNEYTLVLGNGRDLVTVDAAVQFRVRDPVAWRYQAQNPADLLKAIAYRAVMRNTVNHTLSEVLSENLSVMTGRMKKMVQEDADAFGLGVEVLAFTVGGMHPPVPVAPDYEAVVSAQLAKATATVEAQSYRNEAIPTAHAGAMNGINAARAEATKAEALATGEAWGFRTLQAQYRSSPGEYLFRRRLETLEKELDTRSFTVLDARFQRDGGEIWLEK